MGQAGLIIVVDVLMMLTDPAEHSLIACGASRGDLLYSIFPPDHASWWFAYSST
jgi:hypothetical protein